MITDEPALEINLTPDDVTRRLRSKHIITYVVSPDIGYFREMARTTGGEWFAISSKSDFTGILAIFDALASKVSSRISDIQLLAGGSVEEFLRLSGEVG